MSQLNERALGSAAHAMVDALISAGIDRVFAIPGGPISPLVDALLDTDVELVACQHETMAVYAAIGYARATQRPGVILVTSGPGVLNALTGLASAKLDEAPLLLLVGEVSTTTQGRTALQDGTPYGLDIARVTAPLAKATWLVDRPNTAALRVAQALHLTEQIPAGPVVLRVPVDVGRATIRPSWVPSARQRPDNLAAFSPDDDVVALLKDRLSGARRPAVMLGGRARTARCLEPVRALVRRLGVPVFTDLEAKGSFPESHSRSLGVFGLGSNGRAEAYLADRVDCLLLLGARLDDTMTSNFSELLRPARGFVAQLDIAADRLGRSYDVDLAWHGDLRGLLDTVVARLGPRPALAPAPIALPDPAPRNQLRLGLAPHDPRRIPAALERAFGTRTTYASDIGNHLLFFAQGLQFDQPDSLHVSLGLGGMGSGIGAAIGLALAKPKRRVVCVCGDGTMLMVGNELATCVRYQIPVTFAVFNDGQWGMVAHGTEQVYGRSHDWSTPALDLVGYARALGADAVRIESEDDLRPLGGRTPDGPVVLDIPTDPAIRIANPRDATLNFSGTASETQARSMESSRN